MCVTKKDLFIWFDDIKDVFLDNLAHDKNMQIGLSDVHNFVNSFFLSDVDHNMGIRVTPSHWIPWVGGLVMTRCHNLQLGLISEVFNFLRDFCDRNISTKVIFQDF